MSDKRKTSPSSQTDSPMSAKPATPPEATPPTQKIDPRLWLSLVIFGMAGQIAWVVENMYFNVFLYTTVSTDPNWIAVMVAASAAVATLTTILMGALSDRLGTRKMFLVIGYILWGLSTMSFSWISVENVAGLFPTARNVVNLTAGIVILMDCVMTFFGSSANDAAFNAYVTDVTTPETRGKAEGVLQAFPLLAMLIVFGFLDPLTKSGNWSSFFIVIGLATLVTGVVGIFLLPKETRHPSREPWVENLRYGFRPSVMKANRNLYLALILLAIIGTGTQVYMPYLIIYIQTYLGFVDYALLLGIVLLSASLISVVAGRLLDRFGKLPAYPLALVIEIIGLVAMFFARSRVAVTIAGVIFMAANLVMTAIAAALAKDYIPEGMSGRFQGVRMIAQVLIPMLIGPFVGSGLIASSGNFYTELGVTKNVPTPAIFLGAAVIFVFSLLPWQKLRRRQRIG